MIDLQGPLTCLASLRDCCLIRNSFPFVKSFHCYAGDKMLAYTIYYTVITFHPEQIPTIVKHLTLTLTFDEAIIFMFFAKLEQ